MNRLSLSSALLVFCVGVATTVDAQDDVGSTSPTESGLTPTRGGDARAADDPERSDDVLLAQPVDEHAAVRLRARRLSRVGWGMVTFGSSAFVLTAIVVGIRSNSSGCGDSGFCGLGYAFVMLGAGVGAVPLLLVGSIVGGRGTHLRRHTPPARSVAFLPTATRSSFGLTLHAEF